LFSYFYSFIIIKYFASKKLQIQLKYSIISIIIIQASNQAVFQKK